MARQAHVRRIGCIAPPRCGWFETLAFLRQGAGLGKRAGVWTRDARSAASGTAGDGQSAPEIAGPSAPTTTNG